MGYNVFIPLDGVSSQKLWDRDASLKMMEKQGAFITTSESAIFELLRDARNPHFK